MLKLPESVSVPEKVIDSSESRIVPRLIDTFEASVPASFSFSDPAVTAIAPERVLPAATDIGVM